MKLSCLVVIQYYIALTLSQNMHLSDVVTRRNKDYDVPF